MSEKTPASVPSAAAVASLAAASKIDVTENSEQALKDRFDDAFQSKLKKLQRMKFKDENDLIERFPYPSELEEEDGVYMWTSDGHNSYIVLSQDLVQDVLESEFKELSPATGRIRFASYLKQRYVGGPSAPQVTAFLETNDLHQIYRQRRRSQRTKTSVAQAPFKQLSVDLTDIPKRGQYRYLLNAIDLFSKFAFSVPLVQKSGPIIAREIDKILSSLPQGARVGTLRSDNGTEFKNQYVKAVLDKTNTKQVFGLAGNPLSQGGIESFNRTLKVNLFSETVYDKRVGTFGPALKRCVRQYNETVHSSTGFIPVLLNKPNLDPAVIKAVLTKLNKKAAGRDVNARYQPVLVRGDRVRVEVGELLSAIKLEQKSGQYKPSHTNTFSKEVYTVLSQDKDNFVVVVEKPKLKFSRGACLKVNQDAKDLSSVQIEDDDEDGEDEDAVQAPPPKKTKRVSQTDNLPVTRVLRSARGG
jgi:transposase InsO family protein